MKKAYLYFFVIFSMLQGCCFASSISFSGIAATVTSNSISSAKIIDGTITSADISTTANIPFSKLKILKSDTTGLGIPASDSDTTYSAGTGLSLTGTKFSTDSSVVTSNYHGSIRTSGFVSANAGISTGGRKFKMLFGTCAAVGYPYSGSPSFTVDHALGTGIYTLTFTDIVFSNTPIILVVPRATGSYIEGSVLPRQPLR